MSLMDPQGALALRFAVAFEEPSSLGGKSRVALGTPLLAKKRLGSILTCPLPKQSPRRLQPNRNCCGKFKTFLSTLAISSSSVLIFFSALGLHRVRMSKMPSYAKFNQVESVMFLCLRLTILIDQLLFFLLHFRQKKEIEKMSNKP